LWRVAKPVRRAARDGSKLIFDTPGFVEYFASTPRLREAAEARSKAASEASFAQFHFQPIGEAALGCAVRGAVSE
jgi:hypothetical protein